jgi:hypothetical protein
MIKTVILFFLIVHWNLFAWEESIYSKYAMEIIRSFAEEMEKEYGFICVGYGGVRPKDVETISVTFNAYQRATIDEACALEVQATEKLLHLINSHPKIRPYLREYPFTAPRAQISISFYQPDGRPYTHGIVVGYVFQVRGYIFYEKRDENGKLSNLGEEPYEAALKIVQNPHLSIKHNFSRRWSNIKEMKLELSAEDEEAFLRTYQAQTPLQRWNRLREIAENQSKMTLSAAIRELISGVTEPFFGEDMLIKITDMERSLNSGEYIEYWDNGQIKVKAAFKNGWADGHIHGWYENGYDAFKGHFQEGIKQGVHMAFFPPKRAGGPLCNVARLLSYDEKGQPYGRQDTSYAQGGLESFMDYKNGVINGKMQIFIGKNSGVIEERDYHKGKLIKRQAYSYRKSST